MRTALLKPPFAFILIVCVFTFPCLLQAHPVPGNPVNKYELKKFDQDSSLVLQQCLDLPALQQYYPKNADNSYQPVYIMQVPVAFSGLSVSKFQQDVVFESRAQIYTNKRDAFFIFKSFSVSADAATVVFDYNYHYTTAPAALEVTLTLQKTGTEWTITNTTTSQR